MNAIQEEQSRRYPMINGKRWTLQWSMEKKKDAQDRAANIRRLLHKPARVREIPKTVRGRLGRWGVYSP